MKQNKKLGWQLIGLKAIIFAAFIAILCCGIGGVCAIIWALTIETIGEAAKLFLAIGFLVGDVCAWYLAYKVREAIKEVLL